MKWKRANVEKVAGTSLRGHVSAKYKDIIKHFGGPLEDRVVDISNVVWAIKFEDGTMATIYDWKEVGAFQSITDWHVGGFENSKKSIWYIKAILEKNNRDKIIKDIFLTEGK